MKGGQPTMAQAERKASALVNQTSRKQRVLDDCRVALLLTVVGLEALSLHGGGDGRISMLGAVGLAGLCTGLIARALFTDSLRRRPPIGLVLLSSLVYWGLGCAVPILLCGDKQVEYWRLRSLLISAATHLAASGLISVTAFRIATKPMGTQPFD